VFDDHSPETVLESKVWEVLGFLSCFRSGHSTGSLILTILICSSLKLVLWNNCTLACSAFKKLMGIVRPFRATIILIQQLIIAFVCKPQKGFHPAVI
jgi:hypothetical protein